MSFIVDPSIRPPVALQFGAATSDRVTVGTPAHLNNLTKFSALVLCYPSLLNTDRMLISKDSAGGGNGWTFKSNNTTGRLVVTWRRATTTLTYITNTVNILLQRWTWAAMAVDQAGTAGAMVQIYWAPYTNPRFTSATFGTATDGAGAFSSDAASNMLIGNANSNNLSWQGQIAFAAIYPGVLNQLDFSQMIASGQFGLAQSLSMWYPGTDGTGLVRDVTGRAHGTITSGAIPAPGVQIGQPSRIRSMALAGATSTAVTSTAALTLAGLSVAATATETDPTTAALTLAGLSVAATATETDPTTAALTLAGLSVAASATETIPTTAALTLAGLSVAATDAETIPATAALTLAGLSTAASLTETIPTTAALTLGGLSVAATDSESTDATVELTLAGLSVGAVLVTDVPVAPVPASTFSGGHVVLRRKKPTPPKLRADLEVACTLAGLGVAAHLEVAYASHASLGLAGLSAAASVMQFHNPDEQELQDLFGLVVDLVDG